MHCKQTCQRSHCIAVCDCKSTGAGDTAAAAADAADPEAEADDAAATAARAFADVRALTAQPREEDTLLYAIPMAAPYEALAKAKFRVKVTPGGQKRGKAGRQAVELLCRSGACSARCAATANASTLLLQWLSWPRKPAAGFCTQMCKH